MCNQNWKKRSIFMIIALPVFVIAPVSLLVSYKSAEPAAPEPRHRHEKYFCQMAYRRHLGNHTMYYPMEWNASRPSAWKHLPQPAELVIISHSASDPCESFQSCAKKVKSFQNYHISNLKYTDICYNFVIGGDGNVYVGRGWDVVNCHTRISIGINFIGNFMRDTLNRTMIDCMEELLHRGVRYGKVAKDYTLVGHNQTTSTLSPGEHVYEAIKKLPHFSDIKLY